MDIELSYVFDIAKIRDYNMDKKCGIYAENQEVEKCIIKSLKTLNYQHWALAR